MKLVIEFAPRTNKEKTEQFFYFFNKFKKLGFSAYYLKEPKKPLDVKSDSIYENEIKKPISDETKLGFSNSDEVDLLFIRKYTEKY